MPQRGRVDISRYVRPREAATGARSDGFLIDPETSWGRALAPATVAVATAFASRCVVVLGEPGIGKSDVFTVRQRELGKDTVFYDMRWERPDAVFDDARVRAWRCGEAPLHLVLDSLDEASDPHFANHLAGLLVAGPADTLRLALACRVSEWPAALEKQLERLFGDGGMCQRV